ncbi:hypothetical protein ACJJTC_008057 [Scirpophaga incertulas]
MRPNSFRSNPNCTQSTAQRRKLVGGGSGAGILVQAVTHARQTSLMTSRPARRNYKTGRAPQSVTAANRAAQQWRARCRPTPTRHPVVIDIPLRTPAPPPLATPHTHPRLLSHAPKRRIYLPYMLALLSEDVAQLRAPVDIPF